MKKLFSEPELKYVLTLGSVVLEVSEAKDQEGDWNDPAWQDVNNN